MNGTLPLRIQGLPPLPVAALSGRERLGRPYAYDLEIRGPALDPKALLLAPAILAGRCQGIVGEVDEQGPCGEGQSTRIRIVPRLWRLSLVRRSRAFLGRTLAQILEECLEGAGGDREVRLRGEGGPIPCLCQVDETDLDFLHRLGREEGLAFAFLRDWGREDDPERLLILDHPGGLEGRTTPVPFEPLGCRIGLEEGSARWLGRTEASLGAGTLLDWPEGPKVRVEEVEVDGTGASRFSAVPADLPFHPSRRLPFALAPGLLTGRVAEPPPRQAGGGRLLYPVRLPFPASAASVAPWAWVPVARPHGGDGYGTHLPLGPGTEVLLAFPDDGTGVPLILGVSPREDPDPLPQDQALLRTPGGGRCLLDDGRGLLDLSTPGADTSLRLGALERAPMGGMDGDPGGGEAPPDPGAPPAPGSGDGEEGFQAVTLARGFTSVQGDRLSFQGARLEHTGIGSFTLTAGPTHHLHGLASMHQALFDTRVALTDAYSFTGGRDSFSGPTLHERVRVKEILTHAAPPLPLKRLLAANLSLLALAQGAASAFALLPPGQAPPMLNLLPALGASLLLGSLFRAQAKGLAQDGLSTTRIRLDGPAQTITLEAGQALGLHSKVALGRGLTTLEVGSRGEGKACRFTKANHVSTWNCGKGTLKVEKGMGMDNRPIERILLETRGAGGSSHLLLNPDIGAPPMNLGNLPDLDPLERGIHLVHRGPAAPVAQADGAPEAPPIRSAACFDGTRIRLWCQGDGPSAHSEAMIGLGTLSLGHHPPPGARGLHPRIHVASEGVTLREIVGLRAEAALASLVMLA